MENNKAPHAEPYYYLLYVMIYHVWTKVYFMTRFSDKRIIITGGTSGIGLAGAKRIISEGGKLCITGHNPQRVEAARNHFSEDVIVLSNDAAEPADVNELVEAAERLGGIDGLWLNAGCANISPLENVNSVFFDAMMETNVRGPALQMASLSPLLNDGASVVITASSAVYEGAAMVSTYAATKGALVAMARSWARELAPRNIRVNVINPGPIESNLRSFLSDQARQEFESSVIAQVPLGRIGRADEAAAVALFLLSDDASYVTGSQIAVDGGLISI